MFVTTRRHLEALREADQRALAIKERADNQALELARENAALKDKTRNEILEQWKNERGNYVTRELHDSLQSAVTTQVAALQRIVYIGLGVVLALQVLIPFI